VNRSIVLSSIAAIVGGVAISVQAMVLAGLGRSVGSLRAGLFTYAGGGILAIVALVVLRVGAGTTSSVSPAVSWLPGAAAGAMGIGILAAIAYSTGRISVAAGLAMMLVGQMAAAVLLDASGPSATAIPLDLRRLGGLLLLAAGAWLLLPRS
jgi:transporter family-2 protein